MPFSNSKPNDLPELPIDMQVGFALAAFAAALCKQPGINGQLLLQDFLESLEDIAQSPGAVGTVGKTVAGLMDSILKAEHGKPPHV